MKAKTQKQIQSQNVGSEGEKEMEDRVVEEKEEEEESIKVKGKWMLKKGGGRSDKKEEGLKTKRVCERREEKGENQR